MHLVIAYDIADAKRLVKVARRMEQSLARVQDSVFEGDLNERALERLLSDLKRHLDESQDSVRVYRLCTECTASVRIVGRGQIVRPPGVLIL